jgi:hypothetical protein
MAKTAEEIFTSMFAPRDPQESVLRAMEAYAAQEVEAYKVRLKAAVAEAIHNDKAVVSRAPESEYKQGYLKAMTNAKAIVDEIINPYIIIDAVK